MAKLAECNSEDCHRGIEVGSVTDEDGHTHRQVRVVCQNCNIAGPWQVDDSLTRAIADWNDNHVSKGKDLVAQRKADVDAAQVANRKASVAAMEQTLAGYGPEIAVAKLKESDLRKANQGSSADYFKRVVTQLEADRNRLKAELDALKAQ